MSKALITESILTDIANAIIEKGGASAPLRPTEMADAIESIGSDDFVITVTKNVSTNIYEPDCTFAEAKSAVTTGKNIVFKSSSTYTTGEYSSADDAFFFSVVETETPPNTIAFHQFSYFWDTYGVQYDGDGTFYWPYNSDTKPAHVKNGKKFYNSEGYQVGTRGVNYVATIIKEISGHRCWVEYGTNSGGRPNTYDANGIEFEFTPGDTMIVRAGGNQNGSVYVDDSRVANSGQNDSVSYTYTLPENDITIRMEEGGAGKIYIINPTVEYNANGTYMLPGYGKVMVSV